MSESNGCSAKKKTVTLESLNLIAATPPNLLWWTDNKKLPSTDGDCLNLLSNPYYYSEQMDLLSIEVALAANSTESPPPSNNATNNRNSRHRDSRTKRSGRHPRQQRRSRSTTDGASLSALKANMNVTVDPVPVRRIALPDLEQQQQQRRGSIANDDDTRAKSKASRRHSLPTVSRTARSSNNDSSTVCTSRTASSRKSTEGRQTRRERKSKQTHSKPKAEEKREVRETDRNNASFLKGVKIKRHRLDFDKRLEEVDDPKVLSAVEEALESIKCPICLECYNPSKGRIPCALACGHSFCIAHGSHIKECPICREAIPRKPLGKGLKKSVAICETAKAVISVVATTLDLAEEKAHCERIQTLKETFGA